MHCRYFVFISLSLYAELNIADSNAWDCEKVVGGEWKCASQIQDKEVINNKAKPKAEIQEIEPVFPQLTHTITAAPPKNIDQPGFTCNAGEEDQTWSCTTSTVSARKMRYDSDSSVFFASAFTGQEEQVFSQLHSQIKFDPWGNCTSKARATTPYLANTDLRNTAPMDITADYSEVFDKEVTSFYGNVEMIRADQHITSDRSSYNTESETMDAQGNVFYNENAISLYSDTVLLNLATDEARLRDALFISPSGPIRGRADVVYRDSKSLSRYNNTAFTSCRPGNEDWVVHAERLKMNKKTGQASAKHAWLALKGIPVLYTPYISFPLDDRRLSGILPPSFGGSDENGFDITVPYYWNMAPNYDLTVWPRYMSKRGGMLGGEFRHLSKKTSSTLSLEYLPYDLLRKEERYAGSFKNKSQIIDNLSSDIDVNYVSDDAYFDDLNDTLGISNDRFLRSIASLNYNRDGISFSTRVEGYQNIDQDIADTSKPYQKLPQVNLNLEHSFDQWPIDIAVENEYINFYHADLVNGQRFNTKPSIAFPIETAGGFIKPSLSLQHTEYYLTKQNNNPDHVSRTLPIASVDGGLFFEKNFKFSDSSYLHTIEPRLFYLYIPEKDQTDIPVFDSSLYDFGFSSLFRENRFSSVDRVQDANQITLAMTTRLIDSDSGQERLNLSVGEIFYFQDRDVSLSGAPETNVFSNVVAELSGQLTDNLYFNSGIQWNPDVNDITRGNVDIKYNDEANRIINLGYRYRNDNLGSDPYAIASIIQTDSSFRWPLFDNWHGVGRWQYSLKYNSTKESFLGLEKESCCWRFRVIWRRYTETTTGNDTDEMEEGIFFQFELKGLTGFGEKVDEFLEQNLKGYRREE